MDTVWTSYSFCRISRTRWFLVSYFSQENHLRTACDWSENASMIDQRIASCLTPADQCFWRIFCVRGRSTSLYNYYIYSAL